MRGRVRLAAALAALTGLAGSDASDALAADPKVDRRLLAGPVLAGTRSAWVEMPRGRRAAQRVRLGTGGAGVRTVFTARPSRTIGALAGSTERLAFDFRDSRDEGRSGVQYTPHLMAGPPNGPFRELPSNCADSRTAVLDGSLLGAIEPGESNCNGQAPNSGMVIRDLAAGSSQVLPHATYQIWTESRLAVAGRYVAYADLSTRRTTVTVVDRTTGTVLYRSEPLFDNGTLAFDLQPDGKLAILHEDIGRRRNELLWYSPDAIPHALRQVGCRPAVRLAGDRIVVDQLVSRDRYNLALIGLDGRARVLARFGPTRGGGTRERVGTFDFDGQRVTWAQREKVMRGTGSSRRRVTLPTRVLVRRVP